MTYPCYGGLTNSYDDDGDDNGGGGGDGDTACHSFISPTYSVMLTSFCCRYKSGLTLSSSMRFKRPHGAKS